MVAGDVDVDELKALGRAEGLDAVARRFHRMLRARPNHPDVDRPVTLNVWEAVYFDHDLDRLVDLAHRAARIGIERYVLDDGWFGARRDDHDPATGQRRAGRVLTRWSIGRCGDWPPGATAMSR